MNFLNGKYTEKKEFGLKFTFLRFACQLLKISRVTKNLWSLIEIKIINFKKMLR